MNYPALAYWASVKDEEKSRRQQAKGGGLLSAFRIHHSSFFISKDIHFIGEEVERIR